MSTTDLPLIGILDYPGAQQSAVHGLIDLFAVASRLNAERNPNAHALEVRLWRAEGGGRATRRPGRPLSALIVPPSLDRPELDDALAPLTRWIAERHVEGTLVCSVCAGAFLLAETGLLDGRRVTTHWALADVFADRYPNVLLDSDKLIIDGGDIITAGGLMAWVDLGLRLVSRLVSPAVTLATARFFLVDPGGREQRHYSGFSPRLLHGDAHILKLQRWLQTHSGEAITVSTMADVAGLGERTLLRRFLKATGLRPTEYLQHLRVSEAREQLELTGRPVDQIAWQIGYADPGAFRKVFHKLVGITPSEYRRRFSVATGVLS